MSIPDDENVAVNAYRIEQLETEVQRLDGNAEKLNFEQIKQMFVWLGLPVVVATGIFGVALWQSIDIATTTAAETRAERSVSQLTNEVDQLTQQVVDLQAQSRNLVESLIDTRARAEVSAEAVGRQARSAEERAAEAARALAQLQLSAATVANVENALGNVEAISTQIAQTPQFQELVSSQAQENLEALVQRNVDPIIERIPLLQSGIIEPTAAEVAKFRDPSDSLDQNGCISGERAHRGILRRGISFENPFQQPPKIVLSIAELTSTGPVRITTSYSAVTREGFNARITTYCDTKVFDIKMVWIAYSQ